MKNVLDMTWGEFLDGLRQADVIVVHLAGDPKSRFLRRNHGNSPLWATLPEGFDETEEEWLNAKVGMMTYDNVRRRLNIPQHPIFTGWAYVL